jgi:hypothetical protein
VGAASSREIMFLSAFIAAEAIFYFSDFRFCILQTLTVYKQAGRSDTTILGTLGILVRLRRIRHFPI